MFSKVTRVLTLLDNRNKSLQELPNSMRVTYKELFEIDEYTGQAPIDTLNLYQLCKLARINDNGQLLKLSFNEQREHL